jgi:hypothetical protein
MLDLNRRTKKPVSTISQIVEGKTPRSGKKEKSRSIKNLNRRRRKKQKGKKKEGNMRRLIGKVIRSQQQEKLHSEVRRKETEEFFDISSEVELMRGIEDIRDELNIFENLFEQQRHAINTVYPIDRRSKNGRHH